MPHVRREHKTSGEFERHFSFNRMLPGHARAVAGLTSSHEGSWLVSADGAGDLRVWDARSWADAARFKSNNKEPFFRVALSASARCIIGVRSSSLCAYACGERWTQQAVLPVMVNPETGEHSRWCCVAFSPAAVEVDDGCGVTGSDNLLAAASTTHLCVFDYSHGWSEDTPMRSHSILRYTQTSCITVMSCGAWVLTGHENGYVNVWNTYSLTLDRRIQAHDGLVTCLVASPLGARYGPRFASGGADFQVCVWRGEDWALEQGVLASREAASDKALDIGRALGVEDDSDDDEVSSACGGRHVDGSVGGTKPHDGGKRIDRGVSCLAFSRSGSWLISVAKETNLWRVATSSPRSGVALELHQRLSAVGSNVAAYAAIFCGSGDAVVLGTNDGVLNVWLQKDGLPPSPATPPPKSGSREHSVVPQEEPSRPLFRVMPEKHALPVMRHLQVKPTAAVVRPLSQPPVSTLRAASCCGARRTPSASSRDLDASTRPTSGAYPRLGEKWDAVAPLLADVCGGRRFSSGAAPSTDGLGAATAIGGFCSPERMRSAIDAQATALVAPQRPHGCHCGIASVLGKAVATDHFVHARQDAPVPSPQRSTLLGRRTLGPLPPICS